MLDTSMCSTRTFGYFAAKGASVSGMSWRRCVAITVQPFAAYCLTNSRPNPEFAPVINTVSAVAARVSANAPLTSTVTTIADARKRIICLFSYVVRIMIESSTALGRQHGARVGNCSVGDRAAHEL